MLLNDGSDQSFPTSFITSLPPALRTTALLALTGHTRREIRYLLDLPDTALRQRIVQIRRRWNALEGGPLSQMPGLSGHLPFGLIRRALRPAFAYPQARLASHDPDGHLFVISHAHKSGTHGNV
jgi:RNA polymerase sigma-70 factor (ECF subfamily)